MRRKLMARLRSPTLSLLAVESPLGTSTPTKT